MPAEGILVLIPVCAGKEELLRAELNAFGRNIKGKPGLGPVTDVRIEFTASQSIHFARLALLDDPDRGAGRKRLLLATDYDGSLAAHLKEIKDLSRRPDALWGCCEGYAGPADFAAFLSRHLVAPGAYYVAFRGDNLAELTAYMKLQAWFQACLAKPNARDVFWALPDLMRLGTALRKLWDALCLPWEVLRAVFLILKEFIRLARLLGTAEVYFAGLQIIKTMGRIGVIRFFNRLLSNVPMPAPSTYSQAEVPAPPRTSDPDCPPENVIQQNQLTLVTDVHPDRRQRLKAVLALVDFVARRLSPPGSLAGISTIHTVRWALLDDERRFLMVSNYDGTWENYIDEFAEMILSGLDALWLSAPDYPQAGAQDVAALKQFLRKHQVSSNVFYSAYEDTTVLNLIDDREFARSYGWAVRRMAEGHAGFEPPQNDEPVAPEPGVKPQDENRCCPDAR
jgi:hypothetical protein